MIHKYFLMVQNSQCEKVVILSKFFNLQGLEMNEKNQSERFGLVPKVFKTVGYAMSIYWIGLRYL